MSVVSSGAGQRPQSLEGMQLFVFLVGWLTLPLSCFLAGETGTLKVPCTSYLIQHRKGLALFDTGLGPRFERLTGTPAQGPADLENNGNIAERLRAIGVDPAD